MGENDFSEGICAGTEGVIDPDETPVAMTLKERLGKEPDWPYRMVYSVQAGKPLRAWTREDFRKNLKYPKL